MGSDGIPKTILEWNSECTRKGEAKGTVDIWSKKKNYPQRLHSRTCSGYGIVSEHLGGGVKGHPLYCINISVRELMVLLLLLLLLFVGQWYIEGYNLRDSSSPHVIRFSV